MEYAGPTIRGHFEAYNTSYFNGGRVIENTMVRIR